MALINEDLENNMAFEYIKAHFAHEFRTQLSTVNVSLNSLNAIFPTLIKGYKNAFEAGLIKGTLNSDYLQLIHKSIINSLEGVLFLDHCVSKLSLLMNQEKLGACKNESVSINSLLSKLINEKEARGFAKYKYEIVSDGDIEINSNLKEIECCIKSFMEDLESCCREQKNAHIAIQIKHIEKSVTFGLSKSKPRSHILESIEYFNQGHCNDRNGIGVYLLKKLVESYYGTFNIVNSPELLEFSINF